MLMFREAAALAFYSLMELGAVPELGTRPRRRGVRGRVVALFLALVGLLTAGAAVALADAELFPTAARPTLGEGVSALNPGASQTLDIPVTALAPGDATTARRTIVNTSTVPLRYALASESSNPDGRALRDVVLVTITACTEDAEMTLYDGPLGGAAAGFGDTAIGQQAGDRVLGPGERVTLCFAVTLGADTTNDHQGATTSTTWTIASEQVAGNP
jgi:hypothetical protein